MSHLATFQNDPFFSGVNLPTALALEHRSLYNNHDRRISQRRQNADQNLDLFGNPFEFMKDVMNNMGQMMSYMESRMNSNDFTGENGQGYAFSSATVMSMNNRDGGQPKIFQATSEKLRGPEGLERTRKALRDTSRNIEKMEIAHRLGERGHRITKEREPASGRILENREFEHIDDENQFEREWFDRAEKLGLKNLRSRGFESGTNNLLMTPPSYGRLRSQSQEPRHLAIKHEDSNDKHSSRRERRKK